MDKEHWKWNLFWIVLGAFLLRIGCALPVLMESTHTGLLRPDSYTYMLPAKALLADGCMMTAPSSGVAATTRPPGYILILALFFQCSDSLLLPALAGCLFSALSCYPAALTARELTSGKKASYIAGGLLALNLSSIAVSPLILADSILGLCCSYALYYTVCAFRRKSPAHFACACIALGAGCWMKPICTPLLLGGMGVLALFYFLPEWKKVLVCWGIIVLCWGIMLFPVMLRNYKAGAEFDMDSNRGEMLYHSGSAILGFATGENTGILRDRLRKESEDHFATHEKEFALVRTRNLYNHKKYLALIRQYPAAFLATHLPQWTMLLPDLPTFLENNKLTVTGRGTLDVLRQKGIFAALKHYLSGRYHLVILAVPFLLATLVLYTGAFLMILCLIKKHRYKMLLLCCAFGFYLLFAGGPVTMPRYQIPALGVFCVLAGMYIPILLRKFLHRIRK